MLISNLCSICYFCSGIGEERLCVVWQGVLASDGVGEIFGPPCLVLWNLDPGMCLPEIGDAHGQGQCSLPGAVSLPFYALCSQLTKASGQRGIGVASGTREGGEQCHVDRRGC